MAFDNRKNISYVADAPSFSAVITPGTAVQTAVLTYKAGWKAGPPSVTTSTMDQLMAQLSKLDSACKFYKRDANAGTLTAAETRMLTQLRDDPHTSDVAYRNAAKKFGVKPEPRTVNTTPAASTANLPQGVPALRASAEAWQAFEQAHGELFQPPYGLLNLRIIEQYFSDEKLQWTSETLATCYRELKAAGNFRDARTLTRGMNNDLQVVQPYSHARILALRNKQTVEAATAPPDYLSDVEKDAWRAVQQAYPKLPVRSAEFQDCSKRTLVKWATEYAVEKDPSLGAANKKGELSVAVNAVLNQWSRIKKPAQSLSQRVWLG
jgi:hypothetical protein